MIRFLATLYTAGAVKENVLVLDGMATVRRAGGRVVGERKAESWGVLGSVRD